MYAYVWEYIVRSEAAAAFASSYGPQGEWVRLFARDQRYLQTVLLRDRAAPDRFMTVDFWTDRAAWADFRDRFRAEFEELDARFETLTLRETPLGEFEVAASSPRGQPEPDR